MKAEILKIRLVFIILLFAVLGIETVFAQHRQNFNGNWKLDLSSSTFTKYFEKVYKSNDRLVCSNSLFITHKEPIFNVKESVSCYVKNKPDIHLTDYVREVFYTDGRGERNSIPDNVFLITATKWSGEKILVRNKLGKGNHFREYSLSEDGKVLTVKTYNNLSFKNSIRKEIIENRIYYLTQ